VHAAAVAPVVAVHQELLLATLRLLPRRRQVLAVAMERAALCAAGVVPASYEGPLVGLGVFRRGGSLSPAVSRVEQRQRTPRLLRAKQVLLAVVVCCIALPLRLVHIFASKLSTVFWFIFVGLLAYLLVVAFLLAPLPSSLACAAFVFLSKPRQWLFSACAWLLATSKQVLSPGYAGLGYRADDPVAAWPLVSATTTLLDV